MVFAGHDLIAENGSLLAESQLFTTGGSWAGCQLFIRRRSWARRSKSTSAEMRPVVNSWLSASSEPFSAIRSWPANTISVVDSPKPLST